MYKNTWRDAHANSKTKNEKAPEKNITTIPSNPLFVSQKNKCGKNSLRCKKEYFTYNDSLGKYYLTKCLKHEQIFLITYNANNFPVYVPIIMKI